MPLIDRVLLSNQQFIEYYNAEDNAEDRPSPENCTIHSLVREMKPEPATIRQTVLTSSNGDLSIKLPSRPQFPFLKLPAELRFKVYGNLFPDQPVSADRGARLRKDGKPCQVAILRTNRFVYNEAVELLYGTVPFIAKFECCGCVSRFVGEIILCSCGLRSMNYCWQVLSRVRELHIEVSAYAAYNIGAASSLREMLQCFVGGLDGNNELQKLKFSFEYELDLDDDEDEDEDDDDSEFLDMVYEDDPDYEVYGKVTDEQYLAYFLEPFYQLRGLTQLHERDGLEVELEGSQNLRFLGPHLNDLKASMRSSEPTNVTLPMSDTWVPFARLITHLHREIACPHIHTLLSLWRTMQFSFIRGNVPEFVIAQDKILLILSHPKYKKASQDTPPRSRAERAAKREQVKNDNAKTELWFKEARALALHSDETVFSLSRIVQEQEHEHSAAELPYHSKQ